MSRCDACAVAAQHNGVGLFREHFAEGVRAHYNDGQFFGDSATSASPGLRIWLSAPPAGGYQGYRQHSGGALSGRNRDVLIRELPSRGYQSSTEVLKLGARWAGQLVPERLNPKVYRPTRLRSAKCQCNRELVALLLNAVLLLASAANGWKAQPVSDYCTLHPPRPSGRSPHRPLNFLVRWLPVPGTRYIGGSRRRIEKNRLTEVSG
jgi:hypothetical protein